MRSAEPSRIPGFFQRERRRGDLVFAIAFLAASVFLLFQLPHQTVWTETTKLYSQPAFWPGISIIGMTLFAVGHWIGSICSTRIPGRIKEVLLWFKALEYVAWFLIYVWVVPYSGYLIATVLFTVLLSIRIGYRDKKALTIAAVTGFCIVLLFKTFLQVNVPGGKIYNYLPTAPAKFMLSYF